MRSNQPRFIRSSYWGTWSLVLTTRHAVGRTGRVGMGRTVEIDLQPMNGWDGCGEEARRKAIDLNLRIHCTARSDRDTLAHELPVEVQNALAAHIGWDLVSWLLDPETEILGLVNWAKHAKLSNGGASLRASAWGHLAHLIPPARPCESAQRLDDYLKAA